MTSWHSYPKIYALGHRAIAELLDGPVDITEKIDGSQFSFGIFNGEIKTRSKGVEMDVDHPEDMFTLACEWVKANAHLLKDGYTYRAEYLQKPKHNTLAYDRVPKNHLIIFDINDAQESYLSSVSKYTEAIRLGLEVVPTFTVNAFTLEQFQELLQVVSCLGGQKIEGIVIKNYAKFGNDKKVLMGKHVSENFKETHKKEWKVGNPGSTDIIEQLILTLKTPARWAKAVQHLRDAGKLEDSPKDIGMLMKEVSKDIIAEEKEYIVEKLLEWATSKVSRGVVAGLAEWYKEKLAEKQFEQKVTS